MSSRPVMQRPVMDPLFLKELQAPPPRYKWLHAAARGLQWLARKMLSHPLSFRKDRVAVRRSETLSSRLIRGFAYRMLFAPCVIALVATALVFSGTYPQKAAGSGDPGSFGVHYESVEFTAADGTRLTGWLAPVVDARRVLLHKDRLLHHKHPAVVLVHDHGQSQHQMLPLVAPLHEEGIVVLAVGLRGAGTATAAPQTFGLNEAQDVLAAVSLLRERPFVDPSRIAVVGLGTGANAAVLAAEKDLAIAALVLAEPVVDAAQVVARRIGPDRAGFRWFQPVSKWAFEIGYRQDIDDISLNQHAGVMTGRKLLRIENATADERLMAGATERIRTFCRETLRPWERK